jgi:hypothetical protein
MEASLQSDDYSHLQNRLRPFSPKKILSTDHHQPFLTLTPFVFCHPMYSTVPGHYIDFGREYFLTTVASETGFPFVRGCWNFYLLNTQVLHLSLAYAL